MARGYFFRYLYLQTETQLIATFIYNRFKLILRLFMPPLQFDSQLTLQGINVEIREAFQTLNQCELLATLECVGIRGLPPN